MLIVPVRERLSSAFVHFHATWLARVQDFHADSVQWRFCARSGAASLVRATVLRISSHKRNAVLMKVLKRIGHLLIWLAGAVLTFAAVNKGDPYLIMLRGPGNVVLAAVSVMVAVILVRRGDWKRGVTGRALILLWCLPSPSMLGADAVFEWRKQDVLRIDASQARSLGRHFVVGYWSFPEVAVLAEKGLISGVYITKHNIAGSSGPRLREEISALQEKRRTAGLPPLVVAADQEGGIVSHLSPPLTKLPALSTLEGVPHELRTEKAAAFGRIHGEELAALGVNLNLAPVLDLRPEPKRNRLDFNTLIGRRAISADPPLVADIAQAYVRGLAMSGVGAVVKHFPGLGRVPTDIHHFSANLDTPIDELEASDWIPFRNVLAGSKAHLMIGHVALTSVDPDRPASHSKRVVDGIVRKKWNFQGIVMTDDLVMGAIYQRNLCTAVVEALNAGVDLLLVAFDGTQFYRIFACAAAASAEGRLDAAMLHNSDARLKAAFPVD
jgi:beta-N-acetylhexosaminidase